MSELDIKESVRERYGEIARNVGKPGSSCCSGSSSCYDGERGSGGISANLYADDETRSLPEEAVLASLGCGNPTALAELRDGETVLDLGSGGGIDVLLSARRVGPSGKAYGLDMTDDMLALARENQEKAGAKNVEFLKEEIEHIPLPDCVATLDSMLRPYLLDGQRILVRETADWYCVPRLRSRAPLPLPATWRCYSIDRSTATALHLARVWRTMFGVAKSRATASQTLAEYLRQVV